MQDSPLVFHNNRFVPFAEAGLAWHDAGFVFGATLVDNARTYQQRLFCWAEHLARFRQDCEACSIPLLASDRELTDAAEHLLATNRHRHPPGTEFQVVTFATPGPLGFYLGTGNGPPTLGMLTYPVPVERYQKFVNEGVDLVVVGHQPVAEGSLLDPRWKHRSRLLWWLADHAPKPPGSVGILTNRPDGSLTETSLANVLAVIDGTVCTPPKTWILDGISLRVTERLCGELGIPFAERELPVVDRDSWSELLLTGTGFGIAGVRSLNGTPVPWPGPVLQRLIQAWNQITKNN